MFTFAWGWVGDDDTLLEFLLIWCDMRFDEFNPTAKNIWELLHVLWNKNVIWLQVWLSSVTDEVPEIKAQVTDKLQDSPSNLLCMSVNHVENSILDQKSLRTFLHATLVSITIFGEGFTMQSNKHNHN